MSVVPKKKKRTSRWKKFVIGAVAAVALYTIGGFLVAPMIVRSQAVKEIKSLTGLSSTIEKIHVNPYALTVLLEGLRAGPSVDEDWMTLKSLHADLQLSSLFTAGFVLKEVMLEQPELLVRWDPDGTINLNSVLQKIRASTNSGPSEIPAASIGHLSISNAVVRWQDEYMEPGFTATLSDIDLTFTNFHNLQTNSFVFNAVLDSDTAIGASGEASILPLKTVVSAGITDLHLEKYTTYVPDWFPIQLEQASVAGRMNIAINLGARPQEIAISSGTVSVSDLELKSTDSTEPVLTVGTITVSGLGADLTDQTANVKGIAVNEPSLRINRGTNGVTDWQIWIEQILANIPPAEPTSDDPPSSWNWSIGQFTVDKTSITATDRSVTEPVEFSVMNASTTVRDLGPDMSRPIPIELGFELASGGSGTISGNITPTPLAAELNIGVNNLYFPIAQPYVNDILNLKLKNGTVSVNGDATLSLIKTNELKVFYLGDIGVNDVEIHEETDLPFATVDEVKIDDLEIDWPLDDFKVKSVFVSRPTAHVYLREDGTANVEEMVPQSITEQIYHQLNEAWKLLQFEVADVTVTNGSLHLEDRSVTPAMVNRLTNLFVNLAGLVPEATKPATLNVSGNVLPRGPFSVVAEFTPSSTNISAKVAVNAQMVQLSPESPYAGKFLGHLIEEGHVSVDLRYELNGDLVKGENRIIINEFDFGEKTDSEDAVSLPIKLGVSLLKDPQGKIDLDVPVEGDLRDPEFKLGKVVWTAFSNIFKKAVTAPFKLLGKLVGAGDDEDLGSVVFAAGQTELTDVEKKKAQKLSQALKERPALRLEIVGRFDPAHDAEQLKTAQLERALTELSLRLSSDEELQLLARTFPDPKKLNRDQLIQLLFVRTYGVNYDTPAKSPSDLIARRALEQRTQSKVEEEPELAAATAAPDGGTVETFWAKTKDVLALKSLTGGSESDKQSETSSSDVEITTPETSETAEIIIIDEPIPVLPSLPSISEMETKLTTEQTIDETVLVELATKRAETVRVFFMTEAGIEESRLQIANELSGPEPAALEAKVFLGIY